MEERRPARCGTGGVPPGGSSLAELFATNRAVLRGPAVTEKQILLWVDAYHKRTNRWPGIESGPIPEAGRELEAA